MDNHWKHKTLVGNQAHERGDIESAKADYQLALRRAQQLFFGWFDREEAVAAVLVSYHNLADVYETLAKPDRAMHLLNACIDYLREARSVLADDENLAALDHGLARSYAYLLMHRQRCYSGAVVTVRDDDAADGAHKVLH